MSSPPEREEALFRAAIDLPPDVARGAFLDRECAGDSALRQRLDALLAAHDEPDKLIATQAGVARPTLKVEFAEEQPDEAVGQTLGRYKLLEKVGEGGCGVVYVAEQTEPVRRRVALKVIKLGMDTREVIARFEAERQALAMMDHPNIAKVLDAGTTEALGAPASRRHVGEGGEELDQPAGETPALSAGRPYFVMELVRGIRITDYCDQANLTTKERLDLFIKVCQAIQHAHQKGIIHRDIKPSNILVTLHDGVPVPKVIDFGIAKATEGRLTDNTVYTQLHQFIGTPAYMSPEQAEMSGLDIDTRSDIYSLGVLLYELLAGSPPFDPKELMASGIDAMRKTIREKEPVRPSTRLRHTNAAVASGASRSATRHASPASDASQLQIADRKSQIDPDLDWIVMKCLEKDRTRRYETANGLAADLKRHLHHEPVVARPPSARYRFQKAWRRNRLWFSAGATVVLALVLGLGAAAIAWRQEAQARRRADEAAAETRLANQRAEKELLNARLSEARALRSGHQPGRRGQALLAIADAARRQPSIELRNEAIAVLALTDFGELKFRSGRFWNRDHLPVFDEGIKHALGLLQQAGRRSDRPDSFGLVRLQDNKVLREFPFQDGDLPRFWHLAENADWMIIVGSLNTISRWSVDASTPDWRRTLDLVPGDLGNRLLPVSAGGAEVLLRTPHGLTALDGATGNEVRSLRLSPGASHFAFSPDGLHLALFMDSGVEVWNWPEGRRLHRWPLQGRPHVIRFSPTGTQVAVGVDLGFVNVFHVESGLSTQFAAHGTPVFRLCFGPGEETLMTVAWEGLTRWWDITTFRMLSETRGVDDPQLSADGRRLGFSNGSAGSGVWAIERSEVFRRLIAPRRANDGLHSVSFSADGRWLVSCGHQGWDLWEISVGRVVHRQSERETVMSQFLGDGLELLTCGNEGVKLWTLSIDPHGYPRPAGPPRILVDGQQRVCSRVSYAASSDRLALAAGARSVILDLQDPLNAIELAGASPETVSVALSPDSRHVVTATWKGNGVSLFDAQTGQFVRRLSPESASIAFHPDSSQLAINTADGYEVLDTASWQPLYSQKLDAATGGSGPVAYSPDGHSLAIAVDSRVIHLLDSETGNLLAWLTAPDGQNLFGLAFSPDGQKLAAAVQSIAVTHLWDLARLRQHLREMHLDWADSSALSTGSDSLHNREGDPPRSSAPPQRDASPTPQENHQ